jgi:4-aminobutyrate aminotransferase-like enzyme
MNNQEPFSLADVVDQHTLAILNNITDRYKSPSPDDVHKDEGEKFLCRNLIPPSEIEFFSGKGIVLETNKGKFYDFGSMSLNCILGQNDPWINANLVSYILSGSPSYATTSAGTTLYYEIAKKISRLSGMKNAVVNHRQCNGSDVTELAIVAAYKRRRKGQKHVISFKGSYHGQNLTSYAVSDLQWENRFLVDDDVLTIFLETPTHTQPSEEQKELSENDRRILEELSKVGQQAFAVIIEPIQVNNRVNISSRVFLAELKRICTKLDVPLIFDDIQTGYGWLGAFSTASFFGVQPNMMAISKALTGGYGPLAALIMDPEYGDLLPSSTVRKTNGADMRSLAAAKAMIERLAGIEEVLIPDELDADFKQELRDGLLSTFPRQEQLVEKYLKTLQAKYPKLFGELRGTGLIWSMDIVDEEGDLDLQTCTEIQHGILENGVLVRDVRGGLLFKIPLVFTEDELRQGFDIIGTYLQSMQR